jgi:putative ABC transport system permease protein
MRDLKARIRRALADAGHLPDDDIIEELASHAASTFEAARAEGRDATEADRQVDALIAAWQSGAGRLKRRPRREAVVPPPAETGRSWMDITHDVRYGLRRLRRQPGFAAIAALTMALGIGSSTTLFSLTYGVLLKPLPWPEPERLVRISESRKGHTPRVRGTVTNGTYVAWHSQPATIEDLGGWRIVPTTVVVGNGEPSRIQLAAVTPSIFTVLRATPLRGRLLIDDDGRPGGSFVSTDVIVLSHGFWQERFGGRDDAIGSTLRVGGKPLTVVGVVPESFAFPDRRTRGWTPWAIPSVIGDQGEQRITVFSTLARLRPGVTPAQAAAEGTLRARGAPDPGLAAVAMFGGNGPPEIGVIPAVEMMTGEVRPALVLLMAAVALLLAAATANVANLQLARAAARRREFAIRAAIGAASARLTRQLVIESALVGLTGGGAGLALAAAVHRALPAVLPPDFPRISDVAVDGRVMLFTIGVTVVASVACGLLPALHARRVDLTTVLSDDGAAPVGGGMRSPTVRARTVAIVGQLAVSSVLLVGAALLTRSFVALLHADRGYDPNNLLTAQIPLPPDVSVAHRTQLLDRVVARLRSTPGVKNAAFGNALPLLSSGGFRAFQMRRPADPSVMVEVNAIERVVSPEYFAALGLRMIAGRTFMDSDTMTSQESIVVNRSFAATYLGPHPLGESVPNLGMCRGDRDQWLVVGIVDDMRQGALGDPPQPEVFLPHRQVACAAAMPDPILVVRTFDDPSRSVAALRTIVREEAPFAALDSVMTMEDRVMNSLAKPRLYAVVLGAFAAFALTIAAVGLFGVLSYSVAQRTREIGLRTALGARPGAIVGLVVRQACAVAASGIGIGLAMAMAAVKALSTQLYGIDPYDVPTFVAVALALGLMALIAAVTPAHRAARVDPLTALRS